MRKDGTRSGLVVRLFFDAARSRCRIAQLSFAPHFCDKILNFQTIRAHKRYVVSEHASWVTIIHEHWWIKGKLLNFIILLWVSLANMGNFTLAKLELYSLKDWPRLLARPWTRWTNKGSQEKWNWGWARSCYGLWRFGKKIEFWLSADFFHICFRWPWFFPDWFLLHHVVDSQIIMEISELIQFWCRKINRMIVAEWRSKACDNAIRKRNH